MGQLENTEMQEQKRQWKQEWKQEGMPKMEVKIGLLTTMRSYSVVATQQESG